ncbi:hypothetical protein F5Y01DRAFT_277587 [Xylaria sp. FL0043]|nr:hypothetical protein F5Y01DRAFT_277587 [Xylaria sp. FL0043]
MRMPLHDSVESSLPLWPALSSTAPVPPEYEIVCEFCNRSFKYRFQLEDSSEHDISTIKICSIPGCNSRFYACKKLRDHQNTPHVRDHHAVWDLTIACAECNEAFQSETELLKHAKNQKHSPYACSCGIKFARNDVLTRHLKSFTKESAKYPCTFCKRHRGKTAFRRRDHLVQHLQGYHKMEPEEINDISPPTFRPQSRQILTCPVADCEAYRDDAFKALPWKKQIEGRPFQKQSDYNKHMRDVHKESAFPCPVGSCDRVGAKGYMREKDLIKHLADKHPDAPSSTYIPTKPSNYRCAGCGKELTTLETLQRHEAITCQRLRNK